MKLLCPKCGQPTTIDLTKSISEDGELFLCPHCGWKFRYTDK